MSTNFVHDLQPATVPLLIAAHCSTIRRKTIRLETQELSAILDDLVRELNSTISNSLIYFNSLNEIVLSLNLTLPPALISLNSHYFFILLRNTIQVLLSELYTKYQLSQLAIYVLRNCVVLLEYLVKETRDVSKLLHWITDIAFVDALANCLYQIERISKTNPSRRYIRQIIRLLDIFIDVQERLPLDLHKNLFTPLLEPVINCLTSLTYVQIFKDLKAESTTLTPFQKLLFVECPHFLTSYNGPQIERIIEQLLQTILPRYVSILDTHIKNIKKWRRPMKYAIYHSLTILVFAEDYFTSYLDNKLLATLINHLLRILNESTLIGYINQIPNNSETLLIDATLQVFNVLIHESDALDHIKQCKPAMVFQRLLSTPCETIILHAYTMLAYTTDENDLKHLYGYLSPLLCTLLNLLYKAIKSLDQSNSHADIKSQNILQFTSLLKGLVQHQIVRNEITIQNALPFIIESSQKLQGLSKQFILESLWTLSFDKQIAQQMRNNAQFILSLQNIHKSTHNDNNQENTASTSSNDGISQVADGLLWNIIKETEHRKNTPETKEQTNKYDIMISYCTKDKDIVNKIEEILVNEGFTIWLNRDTDNKQNMESIAEAIDKSTIIVCCVSESYRRDNRCVSESVYAFHSKRYLLPLIVQKRYKIDGWLSSMMSRNGCIEFDVSDMKRSSSILVKEINHHCKKRVSDPKTVLKSTGNSEPNVLRFAPDVVDKKYQQTATSTSSSSLPPPRGPILVDKQQQISCRSSSRLTLLGMTPIPPTPSVINANYLKYLPEEFSKRNTTDAAYRSLPVNTWKKKDILDFLYDYNLILMMPLCESMTGPGLLRFYRMCQRKPSRIHSQLNDELRNRFRGLNLPMGVYTQFLIEIDNLLDCGSEPSQASIPTSSKSSQQAAFVPNTSQPPPPPPTLRTNFVTPGPSIISPVALKNTKSMESHPEGTPARNTRIIERTIFRPASTADKPYDFIVETGEESNLLLEQVERYAPQLFLLEQQARGRHTKSNPRVG